jgi:DNA-binding GntR family transcriptional regulator
VPSESRFDVAAHSVVYSSKSDMVTAALREMILTGELQQGTQLRQRDVAARFGVSATPVREALRRLESEGLLESDPHRGSTVMGGANLEPSEENSRIRAALESLAAQYAAERITPEELAEVEAINKRLGALGASEPELRGRLNADFHRLITIASRSSVLTTLIRLLWQALPRGPLSSRPPEESARQHEEIIEALRSGDGSRAAQLSREHVLGAIDPSSPAAT